MARTLILAEKPAAAKRIAEALAEGRVEAAKKHGAEYYKIKRKGKEILVVPAVGHLFVLAEKNFGVKWTYPVFDVKWIPVFEANVKNIWAKKYFDNIKSLAKEAGELISATDYDTEGSVISFNIFRFIFGKENGRRMKFSTLTKGDLVEAYENASSELDFPQIEAGLARHQLDFFWGINVSRALTLALKAAGGYKTLSTGRVQGPTLEILEKRQKRIRAFVPEPYWELWLTALKNNEVLSAIHESGKFKEKGEAEKIRGRCKGKCKVQSLETSQYKQHPPFPFDLTTLQREAYGNFGYSPKQTLDIAQSLYEAALISYPRTSSQKLPEKIGYKEILKALAKQKEYAPLLKLLPPSPKPNEGPKTDSAHPSIFPTGAVPKGLNRYQKSVYDLIVKRFMSVFGLPAVRESVNVVLAIGSEKFIASGVTTLEENWIALYKPYARFKEQALPKLKEGEELEVKGLEVMEKMTQPPKRYSQASILKKLEDLGLGTKATRAQILQTLYDRGYIREKQITVTNLGESVVEALEKFCPQIVSVKLTKEFDADMEKIMEGEKRREDILKAAEASLLETLKTFKKNEKGIGGELLKGVRQAMREESVIGKCKCGGELLIRSSRAGKRFVGCSSYPKCTETFSLPHKGVVQITSEACQKCGLSLVNVRQFKKRPWKLCIRCGFTVQNNAKEKEKGFGNYESSESRMCI